MWRDWFAQANEQIALRIFIHCGGLLPVSLFKKYGAIRQIALQLDAQSPTKTPDYGIFT
jgi:hypothetical protein